ncbi:hypothetical protein D7X33_24035, partial [Butyricicoccus sp. 1XD8-22]
KQLEQQFVFVHKRAFIHEAIEFVEDYGNFLDQVIGKPFYVPVKEELLRYTDELYYEKTSYLEKLEKMLAKDFFGGSTLMVKDEIDEIVGQLQLIEIDFNEVVSDLLGRYEFQDLKHANEYIQVLTNIAN